MPTQQHRPVKEVEHILDDAAMVLDRSALNVIAPFFDTQVLDEPATLADRHSQRVLTGPDAEGAHALA